MRKLTATTAAAVLLTTGLATPAWAAAPPAPTNVKVAWAEGGQIRLTWDDNGEANLVDLVDYAGNGDREVAAPPASEPNELLIPAASFPNSTSLRFWVYSVVPGEPRSQFGNSLPFDASRPNRPSIRTAIAQPDGSVKVGWDQVQRQEAFPGDPLDVPAGDWLKATVTGPSGQKEDFLFGSNANTLPPRPRPSTVTLTAGNEWGTSPLDGGPLRIGTMRVTSSGPPASVPYGYGLGITATLRPSFCNCTEKPYAGQAEMFLQARPNSSAPWKEAGYNAPYFGQATSASTGSYGTREFRLLIPSYTRWYDNNGGVDLTMPASTAPRLSRTLASFSTARFEPSIARVSATVNLHVDLAPRMAMKAALQKWDGKQWRYVRAVQLNSKGIALIPIRAAGRGTTTKYRILTPRVTATSGFPVEASTSKPFTLTVR